MMRKLKSKKSQVEDWFPLLLIIVFLVIVILYISLGNVIKNREAKERIELQIISRDSNQLLVTYLRSPSNLRNSQNTNMADEISYHFLTQDKDFLSRIKTVTNEFFSKSHLESDYSSWSLEINYPGKESIIIEPEKATRQHIQRIEVSKIFIPNKFKDDIEVKLFFVQTKFTAK